MDRRFRWYGVVFQALGVIAHFAIIVHFYAYVPVLAVTYFKVAQ